MNAETFSQLAAKLVGELQELTSENLAWHSPPDDAAMQIQEHCDGLYKLVDRVTDRHMVRPDLPYAPKATE